MANRYVPLEERFWSRVQKSDGCWEWTAGKLDFGYGGISVKGRTTAAHRVSWELANGPIPPGACILHACDNPPCVRPDHLFLGDKTTNMIDRDRKGRQRSVRGEQHWAAKITLEQVAEIRRQPYQPYRELAARFGLYPDSVLRIRRGDKWRAARLGVAPEPDAPREVGER